LGPSEACWGQWAAAAAPSNAFAALLLLFGVWRAAAGVGASLMLPLLLLLLLLVWCIVSAPLLCKCTAGHKYDRA
jgi:hypothetical protein